MSSPSEPSAGTATIGNPEISAAAEWWRNALVRPKQDALGKERDRSMEFAQLMLVAYHRPLSDEQLDRFRDALVARLRAGAAGLRWYCLGIDYDPETILAESAKDAGFDPYDIGVFPIKTTMWLEPGCVKVRHGYGAEVVTIFGEASNV